MGRIVDFFKKHLLLQMLAALVFSVSMAYLSYTLLYNFGYDIAASKMVENQSWIDEQDNITFQELQNYIDAEQITSKEKSKLKEWCVLHYASLLIYKDKHLIFDSEGVADEKDLDEIEADEAEDDGTFTEFMEEYAKTLKLADGTNYLVYFSYYGYMRYYEMIRLFSLIVAFLVLTLLFVAFVYRKVNYLRRLAKELKVLMRGDLHYQVEERGSDEIGQLARGINQLRLSVLEREMAEQKSQEANRQLVAALAHDIRTPLTSLLGYLDLMQLKKYKDEEQLSHFLAKSKGKAEQIHNLSEQLFRYFVISSETEYGYHKEKLAIGELLVSIEEDQFFELEQLGFQVNSNFDDSFFAGYCDLDIEYFRRVLDNLVSNIRKYADIEEPLFAYAEEKDGFLHMTFSNHVAKKKDYMESHGVGIRTCEKIMREHGGQFTVTLEQQTYQASLYLPIV